MLAQDPPWTVQMQVREIARLSTPLVVLSTPLVVLSTPLAVRGPRPMKVRQIAQVPISQVGRGSWERNCLRHAFHRICGRADLFEERRHLRE